MTVDAKEDQSDPEPVFNFRVADYHTYFVGDPGGGDAVLVHNEYGPVGPFTPSGAPATGDSASVLRTIWDFLSSYGKTAASGEQASSLAGCVDSANDMLWPFGEWPNHYGVQYGKSDAYDQGTYVGAGTAIAINSVLIVSGVQGTVAAVGAIRAAGGMTYSVGQLALTTGGTMEFVVLNGRAVALTPALAAELGISGTGVGNVFNSMSNGEGDFGSNNPHARPIRQHLSPDKIAGNFNPSQLDFHGDPSKWKHVRTRRVPATGEGARPGELKVYEVWRDEYGRIFDWHYFLDELGRPSVGKYVFPSTTP